MANLEDAIYGLAVADALGVPGEFKERDAYRIEGMVGGGFHGMPAGTWSDDTSMTLATCDSIRESGHIDCADIRKRFEAWLARGEYTADGTVFDVGNTVATALSEGCGRADERSNGNGSLMRIMPLAFLAEADDMIIGDVSAITHAHPVSKSACVLYIRCARMLLQGAGIHEALSALEGAPGPFERLRGVGEMPREDIRSTGYVVDTLEASLWCLATTDSYTACALEAVNLGDDTDTVAAVAGALAGIAYGKEAIPAEWLAALRGKDVIDRCLF